MTIYPIGYDEVGKHFHGFPERNVDSPRYMKFLLKSKLVEEVVYIKAVNSNLFWVKIKKRPANKWMMPDIMCYTCDEYIFEWVLANYDNDSPEPNVLCPICYRYFTVEEYTGNQLLRICCETCALYEIHEQKPSSFNWSIEGF